MAERPTLYSPRWVGLQLMLGHGHRVTTPYEEVNMLTEETDSYQIMSDGRVVWVNREALIGRFSINGIDVHMEGVCAGEGCKPGPCSLEDWEVFKEQMEKVHGVRVSDKHRPQYLEIKI